MPDPSDTSDAVPDPGSSTVRKTYSPRGTPPPTVLPGDMRFVELRTPEETLRDRIDALEKRVEDLESRVRVY